MGHRPPYVHLASTRRHSRDRFSQAFPVFRALPLPCIILNANRRTKNGGGLGTRLNFLYLGEKFHRSTRVQLQTVFYYRTGNYSPHTVLSHELTFSNEILEPHDFCIFKALVQCMPYSSFPKVETNLHIGLCMCAISYLDNQLSIPA